MSFFNNFFLSFIKAIASLLISSLALISPVQSQTGKNIPEWTENAIWYQIFPERFRNADDANNPTPDRIGKSGSWNIGAPEGWKPTSWTSDWYQRSDWEMNFSPNFYNSVSSRRYGGDLQGVIDKLDYLHKLGVNVIYFNPVFDAVSLHKYDASHYHHIDRFFGPDPKGDWEIMQNENPADPLTWQWTSADLLFLQLVEKAHAIGIRVVLDGVWNHVGRDFWAFKDVIENGEKSHFKNWFKIDEFGEKFDDGFDYKGWWGYKGLPEFTETNEDIHPEVKAHIFAVTKRWMAPNGDISKGIDGWRLDVAEELGMDFWKDWIRYVRTINPDAITVAEIWNDAARHYIGDELFDVVMNYRWAYATHAFFINETLKVSEFIERLDSLRDDFPHKVNVAMLNMMDSHDTERLVTMIVNNDKPYKAFSKLREVEDPSSYSIEKPNNEDINLQKLIALFQYTYVGAPMIYYGTEAGMWGADDPDDRKPMIWDDLVYDDEKEHPFGLDRKINEVKFNKELYHYYASLAALRHSFSSIIGGGKIKILHLNDEQKAFAYIRYNKLGDFVIVLINRGKSEYVFNIESSLFANTLLVKDFFNNNSLRIESNSIVVEVPAFSAGVYTK
ncbi:MAG: glycoside hydrolase family 13 protein [Bacteroidetes bacterium]|nr:glycoside hydrolase family 13 protein [Bacteroidota bacterium]